MAQVTPGKVIAVRQRKEGVLLRMQTGAMELQVETPSVVHVIYSPTGSFPHHPDPMIVRTSWPGAPWKLETTDPAAITLSTSQLRVIVARKNGGLTFRSVSGDLLLQDDNRDGGKMMMPAIVNGERTYHATDLFSPQRDEAFYGLGQHQAGVWNYKGDSVQLSQDNTNISIPFYVSSLGYGMFWNNSSVSRFNNRFPRSLYLDSEFADTIDYYFLYGPGMDKIIAEYRDLTGRAPMFGRWAYGFWQCKNRYRSQEEILGIAQKYRELRIPIDNIVQDWFWWTKMGSFVFNNNYPDPKAMVDTLHREHFHIMISVWPRFAPDEKNFGILKQNGWLMHINSPTTSWPGAGLYDAFNPQARAFYWKLIDDALFRRGFDAWWMDATEPETTTREQNVMVRSKTAMGNGARYADIFPLMTTMAVYQGQRRVTQDKRVFILTRSAAAGMQRNAAAAWSGDIAANWHAFRRQIPAGLNYSISGLPYWTTDIGGFVGGNPTLPAYRELFIRWFEYGAFCPIFRVHGTRKTNTNELWAYGKQAQSILTKYDELRYRLMPYIYSVAWRVTDQGYTMMRPLVMDFPDDAEARDIGNQFLFGPAVLVNPVTDPGVRTRRLYLPSATWYNFWTGRRRPGGKFITTPAPLGTMPLFVRAGSILPMGPSEQYAGQKPDEPIELRIYPGADGDFTLYEDDGTTYNYEKGAKATIPMHWDDASRTLTIGARQGSFPGMLRNRTFKVIWVAEGHGNGLNPTEPIDHTVHYDGKPITVQR
ncbi:MAG TPA: glycoside hydrolase family 31 protein [Terriglobia bacterium]|nr:glycoside hydrolase family 31 protein [Terriglobia bacterium]